MRGEESDQKFVTYYLNGHLLIWRHFSSSPRLIWNEVFVWQLFYQKCFRNLFFSRIFPSFASYVVGFIYFSLSAFEKNLKRPKFIFFKENKNYETFLFNEVNIADQVYNCWKFGIKKFSSLEMTAIFVILQHLLCTIVMAGNFNRINCRIIMTWTMILHNLALPFLKFNLIFLLLWFWNSHIIFL